jgi:hypothetical protein
MRIDLFGFEKNEKHGMKGTPEYLAWINMRQRWYNQNSTKYDDYGGRGIIVCNRWKLSFLEFMKDIGPKPGIKYVLDRSNNDGNYEPGNCKWVTQKESANNRRQFRKHFSKVTDHMLLHNS